MRLRKIHRMGKANEFLNREFLPNYWHQTHRVAARDSQTRYKPLSPRYDLKETLCVKEWRAIASDHTISWQGERVSIHLDTPYSVRGQKVEIRTYTDLTYQAFFAGRPITLVPIEKPLKLTA